MGTLESDHPTAGRDLIRRLAVALPCALALGLAMGLMLAVLLDRWQAAPMVAGVLVVVVGGALAALEDGRVQRRLEARRRPRGAAASSPRADDGRPA